MRPPGSAVWVTVMPCLVAASLACPAWTAPTAWLYAAVVSMATAALKPSPLACGTGTPGTLSSAVRMASASRDGLHG
jgi:hypothetical protein